MSISEDADEKCCTAMVDKRIPLANFKSELEVLLNVPAEFLLVYKKKNNNGVYLWNNGKGVGSTK
jgi:hypothetical protein